MKVRVISAIVALIIIIPIIVIGGIPFYIGASLIALIGYLELLNAKEKNKKLPFVMKCISVFCFLFLMIDNLEVIDSLYIADYERITIILFLLILPIVFYGKNKKYDIEDALFLSGAVLFLGVSFNNLISIRVNSIYYLVFILLITIFSDTFALFVGKLIGRHKMCPSVSPNKTWEGLVGGLFFSTFVSTVFYITMFDYTGNLLLLIILVIFLSICGVLGDLVFSSIKRHYGIKDYGNIMPGHGGVLDRLDSILFVVLAFGLIVRFL